MKKQATLFTMIKKMKTNPLHQAIELSKAEANSSYQNNPFSFSPNISQNSSFFEDQKSLQSSQSLKRPLERILNLSSPQAQSTSLTSGKIEEEFSETKFKIQESDNLQEEIFEEIVKKVKTEALGTSNSNNRAEPLLKQTMEEIKITENKVIKTSNLRPLSDIGYNPYHDAPICEGEDVPFSIIVDCFEEISKTKGENSKEKIIDMLCNMFRTILYFKPDQLIYAYYFCIMKIYPDYQKDKELGIGSSTLFKAISKATGRSEKKLREDMNVIGDIGKVAEISKASQSNLQNFFAKKDTKNSKRLSVKNVIETLRYISKLKGNNSNIERERVMTKLILDSRENESKYIIRFIEANFHIGAAALTMQSGLIKTFVIVHNVDEKHMSVRTKSWKHIIPNYEAKYNKYDEIVTRAINEYPDFDKLIEGLIKSKSNIESVLDFCKITVGVPVNPMLAQAVNASEVVMKRLQHTKFICEYKYDGLRGQLHYKNGKYILFSRNQINMTEAYPDVIEVLKEVVANNPQVNSFIMDSEIVAFNPQTQKILPFQKLSTRGKKNVDQSQIEVNVCVFVFDLLFLNGESLLRKNLRERRTVLRDNFKIIDNKFGFAKQKDIEDIDDVKEFLEESIKEGAEGLMVKGLDNGSIYEPGIRSWHWLKLKKDYLEDGSADTYDLVPIGAYYGTGKRAGIFGGFLLACYNQDRERYETFCVCGRGITDEEMENYHKYFKENSLPYCPKEYFVRNVGADLWLKPTVVWEVKGSDIQLSPIYTAGIGEVDSNRGFGLRFPRIVKIRDDKNPTDATDSTQIAEIYRNQAAVLNAGDDDFN